MKRRVSIVVGGLASAALLTLAPATQASADPGPFNSGTFESNGNSVINAPIGLCSTDVPVLSVPVDALTGGNENTGVCIDQNAD